MERALDLARRELEIPRFTFIVIGSDRGTDFEAYRWAMKREIPALTVPARWRTGEFANSSEGPIRNGFMHDWMQPVVVLGFPGGPGTTGMMEIACNARTPAFWWSEADVLWFLDERCSKP